MIDYPEYCLVIGYPTTLITKPMEEMREMLRNVVKQSAVLGLKLNLIKTNMMVIRQKVTKPLKINYKIIKQVQAFITLDLASTLVVNAEMKSHIALVWQREPSDLFSTYRRVTTSQCPQKAILRMLAFPVFLYTTGSWIIKIKQRKK